MKKISADEWIAEYKESLKEPIQKPRKEYSDWVLVGITFCTLIGLIIFILLSK